MLEHEPAPHERSPRGPRVPPQLTHVRSEPHVAGVDQPGTATVLMLQRLAGNTAVAGMLHPRSGRQPGGAFLPGRHARPEAVEKNVEGGEGGGTVDGVVVEND